MSNESPFKTSIRTIPPAPKADQINMSITSMQMISPEISLGMKGDVVTSFQSEEPLAIGVN